MLCVLTQSTACATAGDAARLGEQKPTMESDITHGNDPAAS
jgi:hypothetical protein